MWSLCALAEEENPEFWRSQAQKTLQSVLDRKLNTNVAKNILFFLGDGKLLNIVVSSRRAEPGTIYTCLCCFLSQFHKKQKYFKDSRSIENGFLQQTHTTKSYFSYHRDNYLFETVSVMCASGMGIATYTAARILKGQLQNQSGEETVMTMDTFPNVGLVKVHKHIKNV